MTVHEHGLYFWHPGPSSLVTVFDARDDGLWTWALLLKPVFMGRHQEWWFLMPMITACEHRCYFWYPCLSAVIMGDCFWCSWRPVNMGITFETRVHGPSSRMMRFDDHDDGLWTMALFLILVFMGCHHGWRYLMLMMTACEQGRCFWHPCNCIILCTLFWN